MPYGAARFTEAFRIFCAQFVFGRSLFLTREELTQFTHENKPVGPTTAKQLLDLAGEEHRLETRNCRYLTAHWFNSKNYSILGNASILPIETRNREPLFLVRVKKFTHSKVDFSIPALSVKTAHTMKDYVISLTPAQIMLNTCREQDLSENSP